MTTAHSNLTAGDKAIAQRLNRAITANYNVYHDTKRCTVIFLMFLKMYPSRAEVLTTECKNIMSNL
jgi:hypothetical protein